jgi:hypothetical protein
MFQPFSAILREIFNKEKYSNGNLFTDARGKNSLQLQKHKGKLYKSKAAVLYNKMYKINQLTNNHDCIFLF